jgi:SNF family Na+-dependent transporter
VWFGFLWLWSMPIILIEYGIGRFTKKSTVESYNKLLGPSYRFMGGFQAMVAFALGYDHCYI